jgi:hypothetical protein
MSVNQPTNPPALSPQSPPSTLPTTTTVTSAESDGNPIATTETAQEAPTAITDSDTTQLDDSNNIETTSPTINTTTTPPTSPPVVVRISLLLTTGIRHAMTLTKGSLKKKGFLPEDNDPYSLTVYQLKQMIFNEWRAGTLSTVM